MAPREGASLCRLYSPLPGALSRVRARSDCGCRSAWPLSVAIGSLPPGSNRFGTGRPVDVGDAVTALYDGQPCRGWEEAVAPGRGFVRLTVFAEADWTSPITGGTVPAGRPRTYLL